MPDSMPLAPETIKAFPTSEVAPTGVPPRAEEMGVLDDDVMIEIAPDRPCGTIRVKLVYAGRSTPIPSNDPADG
jgi:hypothetical protein